MMNKFVDFTDEEIKVLKSALYTVIDDYERDCFGTKTEYETAMCMYENVKSEFERRVLTNG